MRPSTRKLQSFGSLLPGHPLILAALVAVALALGGCPDDTDEPQDGGADTLLPDSGAVAKCLTPAPLGKGPYFLDETKAYKLTDILGNRLSTADLNGDGYPDLVVHKAGSNNRDDPTASPAKIYKNLLFNVASGKGRAFSDVTKTTGFTAIRGGGTGRAAHLAVFADVDNDGDLDVFSGTNVDPNPKATTKDPGDRSEILLNDGKGNFKMATKSDVNHKEMYSTFAATFLDYDRDGNIDLFVGFSYEIYGYMPANQDRLYRGNGDGTFKDVTKEMGLLLQRDKGYDDGTNTKPTWGVTACDLDGDGDQDLLTSSYGRQFNMIWRNDGTKFVEVGQKSGFSGDDKVDYTDNEMYKCYCKTSGKCTAGAPVISCGSTGWSVGRDDQKWRNNGNTFTTACADFDNDGDMDLFNGEIRHFWAGSSSDPSQILLNSGKSPLSFSRPGNKKLGLDRTHGSSSWNEGDITAAFFDFDNDGLQDLIIMDSDYSETRTLLYRQKADHTFEELAVKAGIAHQRGQQVSVADLDGDGDLDVILGTSTMRAGSTGPKKAQVHVYQNEVGHKSNWLKVRLVGKGKGGSNRSAIGAWVKVTAGGVTQLREVGGGYGHFGLQNDLVLHFGLGKRCKVDKVEVRWPDNSGVTNSFSNVQANYLVEIDQQAAGLRYVKGN